ncbi:MAG TPA: EAL domain-containing protein [Actinocrinis sp.]|uniref:putative bifunctional diguanylate cyclase/phosphodiesterase n=1 Tax=Actinocrinis sp. TaxID=1920516 RepID=UPI002DDD92D7|nr:EAL domain-containing protein [Actinocrinis sp.]HEV3171790.1 EAL domain-containing protein [Actinocrinis sp.]
MEILPERAATDATSVGLVLRAADGQTVWANPAGRALIADAEVLPFDGIEPGGAAVERQWLRGDGTPGWLEVQCRSLEYDGRTLYLFEARDVTAGHRERERDRNHRWRLTRVEQLARMGTWEWDLVTGAVEWSDPLLTMFGISGDGPLDYPTYRSMLYPDDVALIETTLEKALKDCQPFSYTHRMYLGDMTTLRVFECYGEVFTDDAGKPIRVLGTARDITEMQRVQEELAHLADHDPLTGLPNRRSLLSTLDAVVDGGGAGGMLLMIDVDNFKDINDVHGHAVGDDALRALARVLGPLVPECATLARLGGDEFAVVLPTAGVDDALALADQMCDAAAASLLPIAAKGLRATISVGAAPLEPGQTRDEILARADLALYESKGTGRNRTRLFMPTQYQHAVQRVNILARVRAALENGRLELDAQPIVDLATGAVTSYELLVRLRDGQLPRVGPADFLPPVERGDLIHELDQWVVATAVAALADPAAVRAGLCFYVNISARSLESPEFGRKVVEMVREAGLDPHRLGLEVTETAAITNVDAVRALARDLSDAGCQFSLDDFGAGFGSFAYLKNLPFTTVKIAGDFVKNADRPGADPVLIDAVVRAAHGLGMRTVAEFVERAPLVRALRDLGVDHGQGFYLGKPAPLRELFEKLAAG